VRSPFAPALLCLLLAAPAWGQDPPPAPAPAGPIAIIGGPLRPVPDGSAVVVNASGSVSAYELSWSVTPETPLLTVDKPPQRFAFLVQPPNGTYIVTATALGLSADGKSPLGNSASVLVVVGGPAPAPSPAPGPGPSPTPGPAPDPPAPAPVAGPLFAILFYDLNDVSVTPIRTSTDLRGELAKLDVAFYAFATTAPGAKPYLSEIATDGSPVVVFQAGDKLLKDAAGKTVVLKSPKSPADVLAKARELRGAK
jgi:hypothetical protein